MRIILTHFRKVKYWPTSDFSVNNQWTPTLYVSQTNVIVVSNVLEIQNGTNVTALLKLQASEVGSDVRKYP